MRPRIPAGSLQDRIYTEGSAHVSSVLLLQVRSLRCSLFTACEEQPLDWLQLDELHCYMLF